MLLLNFFLLSLATVYAQFEVPEARVRAHSPKGFQVSIPDEQGIKLFAFHGKINQQMNGREGGFFSRDITRPMDGRWTFQDDTAKLNIGDTLYYWTYVDYDDGERVLGYTRDDQNYTVTNFFGGRAEKDNNDNEDESELLYLGGQRRKPSGNKNWQSGRGNGGNGRGNGNRGPPTRKPGGNGGKNKWTTLPPTTAETTTLPPCLPSETTINDGKETCSGELIFEEKFETLSTRKWQIEHRFAGDPDYEFVLYENDPINMHVENQQLFIRPRLFESKYGKGACLRSQELDLGINCTGVVDTPDCVQKAQAFIILPPVISGRINSKNSFSFRYGTVEIKARLPQGNWIYPELYLVPKNQEYGLLFHKSGEIVVAFLPGNDGLRRKLYGGVILGHTDRARTYAMYSTQEDKDWSDDFHVYTVKWESSKITVSVDGRVYGNMYPPSGGFASLENDLGLEAAKLWKQGSKFAPFDQEMYVVLGVGVGGHSFSDSIAGKPYKNKDPKNQRIFYNTQDSWKNTWQLSSQLIVDYVKVYAI